MTATALLFRDDAYLQQCDATVVAVTPEGGVTSIGRSFTPREADSPGMWGQSPTNKATAFR